MSDLETSNEPIHDYFELTYSSYLVLPRSVLQSMPIPWQRALVALLREAEDVCDRYDVPKVPTYQVRARDAQGRFVQDPLASYERGCRRLWRDEP